MTDTPKSGLPKVAAARLRAGSGLSPHPDANLLAAFSEKALGASEREQVLTHLAACADCREIVSLSQAPEEEKQAVREARGWFGMRPEFMRWAIVGASATVVVAAVLLMKPEQHPTRARMGEEISQAIPQSAPEQAPKVQESESETASKQLADARADKGNKDGPFTGYLGEQREQDAASRSSRKKTGALATRQTPPAAPPPSLSRAAVDGVIGGATTMDRLSGNRPAMAPAPVVIADADNKKQATEPAAANQLPSAQVAESAIQARNEKAEASAGQGFQIAQAKEKAGGKAGPDSSADNATFHVATGNYAAKDDVAAVDLQAAERTRQKPALAKEGKSFQSFFERTWRIADGRLQWSADAGKTWHGIQPGGDVKFLSVDARQSSVWAGGTSGVVMRSADGGATWVPVEKGWSGDVVYLKFEDAKRGVLRTSSKEEWFTEDGGATWQRR
jgi:hypothetical protein